MKEQKPQESTFSQFPISKSHLRPGVTGVIMAAPTDRLIEPFIEFNPRHRETRSEARRPQLNGLKKTWTRWTVTSIVLASVVAGLTAIRMSTEPYGRIDGEKVPPVAVSVTMAKHLPAYSVTREFVGLVEARRESRVGFEMMGQLSEILVDDGDFVESGAVLARLETSILRSQRDTLLHARNQAQASLDLAAITRERVRRLHDHDVASAQEKDQAEKRFEAEAAALARAESAITSIDTRIARSELIAPYPALVARRLADEGQVVGAGDGILHLLERVEPEARIGVAGDSIDAIAVGERHELRVRNRHVSATVKSILPVRGNGTRSVDVVFTLHTEFDGIRRGDLAKLSIERLEFEPGFWLPLSALTESSRGLWACYVVFELADDERIGSATHTLRRRELEIVHQEVDRVFVRGTLSEGETIVLEGLQRLVPGQSVRIADAASFTTLEDKS
jgi:RND family efflux transporter MFP subunit